MSLVNQRREEASFASSLGNGAAKRAIALCQRPPRRYSTSTRLAEPTAVPITSVTPNLPGPWLYPSAAMAKGRCRGTDVNEHPPARLSWGIWSTSTHCPMVEEKVNSSVYRRNVAPLATTSGCDVRDTPDPGEKEIGGSVGWREVLATTEVDRTAAMQMQERIRLAATSVREARSAAGEWLSITSTLH